MHRHGVVDHRELENLGDVAAVGRDISDVLVAEPDSAAGRRQQAGDDIEQCRLAAARRAQKGIGAAVGPFQVDILQGPICIRPWVRQVTVLEIA